MASVEFVNVTKKFNDVLAVSQATFKVEDNKFVVLVGPSGCGKSTVLRMVAGLEQMTSGEIYIGDRLVNNIPSKDRDIAMVFQNYALYPHMTVYENMAFGLKLRKYKARDIEQRVMEAAEILEIRDLLKRRPKALSGGQRQRVAVGRAIVRKPRVFLFDEPLSNLDAKLRVQMRTEISKLHHRLKTTMIYVTHDQMEAMTMGDNIVVMKDGLIQQIDTPITLYNHPGNKFVAGFIGSPAMNFLRGKLNKTDELWFDEGKIKLKVPSGFHRKISRHLGQELILGIRPEDIYEKDYAGSIGELSGVRMKVEVIEPVGNEIILYLHTGLHPVVARINTRKKLAVGRQIDLGIDMSKAHFFDRGSEKSLIN